MTPVPDRRTFGSAYTGQAPWDIGRPQQAFLGVADRTTGPVLDAGCGTGDNALFFARRGHKVTGIDFLEGPIRRAKRKAAQRGLSVTFLVMDALALKDLRLMPSPSPAVGRLRRRPRASPSGGRTRLPQSGGGLRPGPSRSLRR
jgi:SAM-dependent methyltransferase